MPTEVASFTLTSKRRHRRPTKFSTLSDCSSRFLLMELLMKNYDNFDQTIMDLEASQKEDPLNQAPQAANHYGAMTEESCYECFTPLTCN